MAQLVACPECKKPLQVPDDLLGKKVQCPECKHTFTAQVDADEDSSSIATTTTSSPTPSKPKPPAWEKKSVPTKESEPPKKKRRDRDDDDDDDDDDNESGSRRRRRSDSERRYTVPHRGGMILTFGIIGLVIFPIFGVLAWILGNSDLREMQAGRMDPTGEGMTQTGKILGMIATILWVVGVIIALAIFGLYFCVIVFFIAAVAGAAAQKGHAPPQQR